MIIQERYHAAAVGVNSTYKAGSGAATGIAGFLAVTAGTLTATRADGTIVVNALPVSAGVYYPIPFLMGHEFTVTLAGGASGTIGVS